MQDDRSVSPDEPLFFCANEEQNPTPVPTAHFVNGHPLEPPFPEGMQRALFGMGCFWGAEKKFWQKSGVFTTAVGYAAGATPNPTYREVCTGRTGHSEVVLVVFDPAEVSYDELLKTVLGEPRSDAGHAAGQRRRHAVPLGHLLLRRRAAGGGRGLEGRVPEGARRRRLRRDHDRDPAGAGVLSTPRTTTSSTSRRIPTATAASGGTGVSCPVGVARTASPPPVDTLHARRVTSAGLRRSGGRALPLLLEVPGDVDDQIDGSGRRVLRVERTGAVARRRPGSCCSRASFPHERRRSRRAAAR